MEIKQIADLVLTHSREITALQESTKSAHHRIGENNQIAAGINDLAKSVAEMASEVKHLTKRVDTSIEKIEIGQKAQGERIGNIEKIIMSIDRAEKYIENHGKRLDTIEKAGAHKWDKFIWLIFSAVAAAVVAFILSQIF